MFSLTTLAAVALAYLLLLFAIAFWGDRLPAARIRPLKPLLLALAGTYTSAWMFFGTPAQAVEEGWLLPPTFVGASLMLIVGAPLLTRFVRLCKQQGSTSIADFISAQFGGSQWLAAAVAVLALVAVLPYLALQLRAVADSFLLLASSGEISSSLVTAIVSVTLGLFALLFGTRHIDSSVHRNGMLLAVAFEALVKIGAFVAVAWFVVGSAFDGGADLARAALASERVAQLQEVRPADTGYFAVVVLGMAAMFCLPRQFHILMIESDSERDIGPVRKLIPLYLGILSVAILVVGYGGLLWLPESYDNPERFVLGIPLQSGSEWLSLLAFIGGLSAGSSMVIIATIALSTMIANTMVVPWWLRRMQMRPASGALGSDLRRVRRGIIGLIMLAAFTVNETIGPGVRLGTFGLLSLALVAQLAPAMIAAVCWPRNWLRLRSLGVIAGLAGGALVWALSALPAAVGEVDLIAQWLGLQWSSLSISCVFGLGLNCAALLLVSKWMDIRHPHRRGADDAPVNRAQLRELLARFVGSDAAARTFAGLEEESGKDYREAVEKILAGIVGSTSARRLVRHYHSAEASAQNLEQASAIYQFGRGLLQSSIDNIDQGISVVDANLNLVAWNRRYVELFHYPAAMIYVGRPVAELVRYNASRGECGPGAVEMHVQKRVEHLKAGTAYRVQRHRTDGTVLEIRGNPLPGGGFVTTYTDVSDYQRALAELTEVKDSLEQKVTARTAQLQALNSELHAASVGKTRFLAAASHDLVQPLNASRLFLDALTARELDDDSRSLLGRADNALAAAEQLITDMLQIARMDAGDVHPNIRPTELDKVLAEVVDQARPAADARRIQLRYRRSGLWVLSDEKMLRRVVQNLLDNAIKYTRKGGVLIGARNKSGAVSLQIWDTGCGIDVSQQQNIFREFCRLDLPESVTDRQHGYGLGLATVERLCRLLESPIELDSTPGRGSVFRVRLPRAAKVERPALAPAKLASPQAPLNLQVVCVDNEPAILEAMQALLSSWGCSIECARGRGEALQLEKPDLLLMDFHLGDSIDGIGLARQLMDHWGTALPCVIISAENTDLVKNRAQREGWQFLQKPLRPAALRALLQARQKQLQPAPATKVV
ncbi:hybrid sensor histidine kinase/response regulator [Microbulbifer marinus]|uniref:histidine kinase n=1 Tax=Microbulbifer marinus TaxID=658218 RepID=A0A1H3YP14_9GAMM|nr:PAS domain-containing hybrid sensor histidine kinase/response regulator [Microbulbifer marinus]SEA13250.1 Na+/proline symporter [Microbulbifer marinus]